MWCTLTIWQHFVFFAQSWVQSHLSTHILQLIIFSLCRFSICWFERYQNKMLLFLFPSHWNLGTQFLCLHSLYLKINSTIWFSSMQRKREIGRSNGAKFHGLPLVTWARTKALADEQISRESLRNWKMGQPTTCGRRLLKAIKTSGVMARQDTTVGGQRPTPAATCSVNSPICRRSRRAVINSTKRAHVWRCDSLVNLGVNSCWQPNGVSVRELSAHRVKPPRAKWMFALWWSGPPVEEDCRPEWHTLDRNLSRSPIISSAGD